MTPSVTGILPVAATAARSSSGGSTPHPVQPVGASAAAVAAAPTPPQQHPMRFYGGIEGMNAAKLIVALQANGTISGGYSEKAIETGGTPPPAIVVDRGA